MHDTTETLKSALADLAARVAAFEKARVEEEGPPALDDTTLHNWLSRPDGTAAGTAAREILYLRRELAWCQAGTLEGQPYMDAFNRVGEARHALDAAIARALAAENQPRAERGEETK